MGIGLCGLRRLSPTSRLSVPPSGHQVLSMKCRILAAFGTFSPSSPWGRAPISVVCSTCFLWLWKQVTTNLVSSNNRNLFRGWLTGPHFLQRLWDRCDSLPLSAPGGCWLSVACGAALQSLPSSWQFLLGVYQTFPECLIGVPLDNSGCSILNLITSAKSPLFHIG